MAPEKKRLGKKHRSAQTRPHKGATPKGAKASASASGGASPKGRKTLAAKKSAAFSKSKVRTQSPERQRGRAVTGAQRPSAAQGETARPIRGTRGLDSGDGARARVNFAALSDPETENAFAAILPLIEEAQQPSDAIAAPLFAICGRPNVGKSTLFNRMTGTRRSIVGDEPGITRDRIYGEVDWEGRVLRIVDTGGVVPDDEALIPTEIFRQARIALDEAGAIVQVVDGRSELTLPDIDLARLLIRSGKPVFLAVNKMDTSQLAPQAEQFRTLGFKDVFAVSAEHGLGISDLLDAVSAALPVATGPTHDGDAIVNGAPASGPTHDGDAVMNGAPGSGLARDGEAVVNGAPVFSSGTEAGAPRLDSETWDSPSEKQPKERKLRSHGEHVSRETRIAIIGRPNVGKSTLLNALTGTDRAIVSPIAGTTRDAVDETVEQNGHNFRFVDTAGIRRKGKTTMMAEKLSVIMARKHLEAADVALLVIDATEGVTALDANIGGYAHESGRSVIILVNKWDAVTTAREDGKAPADQKVYTKQVRDALKYLDYAPLIFISAKDGMNVGEVFKKVQLVARERRKRITTGQMNRFLETVEFEKAGVPYNKRLRIYYMTQAAVAPPTFVLFTDRAVKLHFSYERFLENQIRASFRFIGSPIWFKVRARNKKAEK